jgi:ABC-type glycerol-3-phosphate transport system substrate-binding protein
MKKLSVMPLVFVLMLLLLEGCSKPATPGSGGDEKTSIAKSELIMWTFLDVENPTNGRAKALGQIINDFEAKNSGITVKVEPQDHATLPAKVYAAWAAGNAPDVFQVSVSNLGEGLALGVMEPLENLFYNKWSKEDKDDVAGSSWEVGVDAKGNHYQVLLFAAGYGLLYREDMFKEFGIEPNFETWDDLYEAAKKLTHKNKEGLQVYGLGIGYDTSVTDAHGILPNALLNQPGGLFTSDGHPNNWTGRIAQKALQMELDAVKLNITPENAVSTSYEDIFVGFQSGQYAIIFVPTLRIPTINTAVSFDTSVIKFMEYPVLEKGMGHATYSGGWFTCVSSKGTHKEASGKFLEYLCSPEADKLWVTVADQVPIRKSTSIALADYISQPGHEWLKIASQMKPYAWLPNASFKTTGINEDFQKAFINTYTKKMNVNDALKQMEADFVARNIGR